MKLFTILTLFLFATPVLASGEDRRRGSADSPTYIESIDNGDRTTTTMTDSPREVTTTTRDRNGNRLQCVASRDSNGEVILPANCRYQESAQ